MSEATDTDELSKEEKAAAETAEAKQEREAKRRERSVEIFNEERWSREETLSWIARRDPQGMNRSLVSAVFYDRDLPGREPSALLAEAIVDQKITEYSDGRRTWYRSEQVKAAFPAPGLAKPVNKRQATISAIHELGVGNLASMSQKNREGAVMERLKQKGIAVSDKHVRNIWKDQKERPVPKFS